MEKRETQPLCVSRPRGGGGEHIGANEDFAEMEAPARTAVKPQGLAADMTEQWCSGLTRTLNSVSSPVK